MMELNYKVSIAKEVASTMPWAAHGYMIQLPTAELITELMLWCSANMVQMDWHYQDYNFYFRHSEDVIMFRLANDL